MSHYSPWMALVFVGFIMVVNITLLNLVTGIIVENVHIDLPLLYKSFSKTFFKDGGTYILELWQRMYQILHFSRNVWYHMIQIGLKNCNIFEERWSRLD